MRLKPVVMASEFMRFGFKPCRGLPKSAESYYLCVKNGHRVMFVDSKHFTETEWPIKDARIHKNPNCRYSDKRTATEIECELVVNGLLEEVRGMNTLGYRLVELLKAKDMTQKKLAYTIGVSEVSISRYVNNERKPRAIVLYKMAEVLGVSAEYLLTGNKKEEYGKWIPVSERLPKKPECGVNGYIVQKKRVAQPFSAYWDGERWTNEDDDVIDGVMAWLPLPEPYREGE